MKRTKPFLRLAQITIAALGLAFISSPPSALAASPTVRVSIQQSTNRTARLTWGPPQATLQCSDRVTGNFTNVQNATVPHSVNTLLGPSASGYRACLSVGPSRVFIWRDTILQPGRIAIEWSPRDSPLQQSADFVQWQNASTPPTDWFYPLTPLETPAVSGGVLSGARLYRVASMPLASSVRSSVFSVNHVGYANLVFQVGNPPTYFSFPLAHPDQRLDTLLPLGPEADGTTLRFLDPATRQLREPMVFFAEFGWLDFDGTPAVRPPGQSACAIIPRSSAPGATTVVSTTIGEISSGTVQRVLPSGLSLNGPLIPLRGGITTVHNLQPNEGDQVSLFNPATRELDDYEFFADEWIFVDEFSIREPVIGPGDAFYYNNSDAPFIWTSTFQP
jgi:hypothetical protein